jgi:Na+-translocating ferredoxin:NAD+ oxidoreductase RnfG subunit
MKKLFENPLIHYSFVLMVVAFACGLAIGGINALTAPIIEENARQAQVAAYERVLPGIAEFNELSLSGDPRTILSKIEGKNAQGDIIGYIYVAYGTNKFGSMRIIASIGQDGTILGVDFIDILQTYNVNDTRTNLSRYQGRNIAEAAPIGDMISGVTGSRNTLIDLMGDIAIAHLRMDIAPTDPYAAWFDVDISRTNDSEFSPTGNVISRQIVKNEAEEIIAYIYEINRTGESYEGNTASITIHVGVDLNLDILGILIPEETYNHTKGYRNQMIAFANSTYANTNISDIDTMVDGDLVAGATNSSRLISQMMEDLKEVLLP